jgi:uncharacterized protein (DUF1015 family)
MDHSWPFDQSVKAPWVGYPDKLATVHPFQPYRYTAKAGDPKNVVTQPYDKISPTMRANYLAASPYNLVRIILGERQENDSAEDNCYTRAARHFQDWMADGILAQDATPGFYAYSQEFTVPDTLERATRVGFIGLGQVEAYDAGIVYRHEHTLAGPKKDRMEVLRHTRAHFGHIFMLYSDPAQAIDAILADAAQGRPVLDVVDDYEVRNRLWAITDASVVERVQALMGDKRLLIADGHHRYETALNYHLEHPGDAAAKNVMMTFVNMDSPGLRILATHRVLRRVPQFDVADLLRRATANWTVLAFSTVAELKTTFMRAAELATVRIGMVTREGAHLLTRARGAGELDVPVLHTDVFANLLSISEAAVREESYLTYVRGIDAAAAEVREKDAQAAFLLDPTPIQDMADIAFGGGVMPQKSTDFFPKLLSGITIYKL